MAMDGNDRVARLLGMSIDHATDGAASVSMTVREEMLNGLDVCHGGILFTLADTAMAHASNAGNRRALSTSASIEWIRPATSGDRLTATCSQAAGRGRSTVHDVTVRNQDGDIVALLRGQTLTLGDPIVATE